MNDVWTELRGSFSICARDLKLYAYRPPSERRPDQFRIRIGVCPTCKGEVKNLTERDPARLLLGLNTGTAKGNVRLLEAYRSARRL